ncbi:hypothetical protein [Arsenophonus symbiont of Ornithomya chloropus]|uniref:hypothetical protein n=1 Tax=Arsenophonus symbiont of Ornithomya chloropus TaxID=634121 RepID=UPI0032B265DE
MLLLVDKQEIKTISNINHKKKSLQLFPKNFFEKTKILNNQHMVIKFSRIDDKLIHG